MIRNWFIFAPFLCAMVVAATPTSLVQSMTSQEMIAAGREAYVRRCSGCHGVNADGNSEVAKTMKPRPRNLVAGSFKFRSTPAGVLPTVQDLMATINHGIMAPDGSGFNMPSFRAVGEEEKLALVAYIRSLRPEFSETKKEQVSLAFNPPPQEIFSNKAGLLAAAARGKVAYAKNCRTCHGDEGKGNGPSSEEMVDSDDQPIKPANLTLKTIKNGPTARDIFRAITVGLEGAPMPGYADTIKESERWDLTAYVFYLRGRHNGVYDERDELK